MFDDNTTIYANGFFEKASEVYAILEDDLSKEIFLRRIEYNVTKSINSLERLTSLAQPDVKRQLSQLKNSYLNLNLENDETVIIYGARFYGKMVEKYMHKKFPKANFIFCDRDYNQIKNIEKNRIISPDELYKRFLENKVIIASIHFFNEIFDSLVNNGIDEKNIFSYKWIMDAEQYYPCGVFTLHDEEIFVDAGAYDGNTVIDFAKKSGYKYNKIYAFEPDRDLFLKTQKNTLHLPNIELFERGLWDVAETMHFTEGEGSNKISSGTGSTTIETVFLDNILTNGCTFIKLDIEGAELKALKGAKNIIQNYKPKLAICVYHKNEDIIDIPLYIMSLAPEYKLYIRHHSNLAGETVLYAVVK